jgi:DNA-binding NtrC family response regulator
MAKILLIDDDVDMVEMYKIILTHRGHKVTAAYNAAEARALMKKRAPADAVVLDVMMETATIGFDLAREIHQKYPKLPILMLSGVRGAKDLPFKFEPDETWLPILKFLEKPVSAEVLGAEVDSVVSKK